MVGNLTEAADLPKEDKVYLKKDMFGWRIVEPIKDPITGKINWLTVLFGGKRNRALLLFLVFLLFFAYMGVNELISDYKKVAQHPCNYCSDCSLRNQNIGSGFDLPINISIFNNEKG